MTNTPDRARPSGPLRFLSRRPSAGYISTSNSRDLHDQLVVQKARRVPAPGPTGQLGQDDSADIDLFTGGSPAEGPPSPPSLGTAEYVSPPGRGAAAQPSPLRISAPAPEEPPSPRSAAAVAAAAAAADMLKPPLSPNSRPIRHRVTPERRGTGDLRARTAAAEFLLHGAGPGPDHFAPRVPGHRPPMMEHRSPAPFHEGLPGRPALAAGSPGSRPFSDSTVTLVRQPHRPGSLANGGRESSPSAPLGHGGHLPERTRVLRPPTPTPPATAAVSLPGQLEYVRMAAVGSDRSPRAMESDNPLHVQLLRAAPPATLSDSSMGGAVYDADSEDEDRPGLGLPGAAAAARGRGRSRSEARVDTFSSKNGHASVTPAAAASQHHLHHHHHQQQHHQQQHHQQQHYPSQQAPYSQYPQHMQSAQLQPPSQPPAHPPFHHHPHHHPHHPDVSIARQAGQAYAHRHQLSTTQLPGVHTSATRYRQILDKMSISEILYRYYHYFDSANIESWLELWASAGELVASGQKIAGTTELSRFARGHARHSYGVTHVLVNPIIELRGEAGTNAVVHSRMMAFDCRRQPARLMALARVYWEIIVQRGEWRIIYQSIDLVPNYRLR
ncbi:hypothetical protein H696_00011 [Fonticula alba]|uniref:SnoaL-like domain-containing protein n=1 Tax=Fonticula alba TaxID=691883 RepID=A0A058ZEQ3_FONAL|nr:hypothetical protein H696_00011 [Fonticula alba]KCV72426.1 hypothetical protein H696_00011 [Fonticula alba]|eukprot:XP_009492127.1 hypothetical protein H696_00011 [Fonticula alba]